MEIAPISGIRLVPATKSKPAQPELSALFEIESTARPDDDSFTDSGKKAAGAEEPEEETDEHLAAADEAEADAVPMPPGQINFFA